MNLRITKKDGALIAVAAVLLLAVAAAGWLLLGEAALVIAPVLSAIVMLVVLLEIYRRLEKGKNMEFALKQYDRKHDRALRQLYHQVESLLSLFFTLKPELPLPDTRAWAASPDLLKKIVEVMLTEKPAFVLEASSGTSTLVIAYCLKKLGKGKILSLEHDAKFAAISKSHIALHGLEDISTIVHAPLKEVEINGKKWLWYDTDRFTIDQPIDMLFVDGPPGKIQKLSRYPALPLLYKHLNNRATIILDDGIREDEKQIVAMWEKEFSPLSAEYLETEKGTFIIHKNAQA